MYQYEKAEIIEGRSYKYVINYQNEPITYSDFLTELQENADFRKFYIDLLKGIEFNAHHWETPPVTASNLDRSFEFVITDSPGIDLPPDPGPFQKYLSGNTSNNGIAVFDNLGGDAKLVAPEPDGELNYSHIGVFTRNAPLEKQFALWKRVGELMANHIADKKIWLNTAGGGVAWLHVRLDSRPKYYKHRAYKGSKNSEQCNPFMI